MANRDNTHEKFPRKFGKYHLIGPLAQGGMGALYLATTGDRGLERLLVIKTVLPHLADAEYIARFRDEAKVVVKLSHGNLIPVFDAGQVGGELFLCMDFVEGKDLRALWNRCAKKAVAFPIDVAAYLVKELCRGLAYAHAYGDIQLVHRDVSPPNVLISYSGEVKLTDFGLAASTMKLEKTAPGIIYGKVAYMSPEQARGEKLDGRSDLYAAAIILWELLTGRQLFPPGAEQPQDLLKRARDPSVLAPSSRAPRVPEALDQICVRALAPDRDDRYESGEEFREALASWLASDAPGTDATRVETFMRELFADDIVREADERKQMLQQIRERVKTLPPTDELRQLIEQSEGIATAVAGPEARGKESNRRKARAAGTPGRRATDGASSGGDRRRTDGRRDVDTPDGTVPGIAVNVPPPGPTTVLTPPPGQATAAAAEVLPASQPEHAIDLVGQVLNGRYKVAELIGEGGMGRVYLAEHVEIGKQVAVKVLHPVYGRMPDLVERFRREARAASKIGHPHIVDVTDSGTTEDGSVYFVMEYLQGMELADVIDREGAMEVSRSLRIAAQICQALSAAHAAGIIHRDLKPENIFLMLRHGTSDFVKVLDFGIAKSTEAEQARDKRLTSPGMAMGTPEYMSPEQAAGRPADERCDIYSLGAILYETLTGVAPYEGDNFMEVLTKKATLDPPPPRSLRMELPPAVDELVVRAMSRDPEDRPPTMEAFEYELTKCLEGRGTAVAQMIGMSSDPALVASLNPGINVRLKEHGLVHHKDRPPTAPPAGYPDPTFGAAEPVEPVSAVAATAAASSVGFDDGLLGEDTYSGPGVRAGGVGVFGWILLIAFLLTGLGVVFFVAAGERSNDSARSAVAPPKPKQPEPDPKIDPVAAAKAAEPAVTVDAGVAADPKANPPGNGAADPVKTEPKKPKKTARPHKRPSGVGPPKSRSQARTLLRQARKLKSKMKWGKARALYKRVADGRYMRGSAYVGLANVSFESKDTDGAIKYARKALRLGVKTSAWMVLGHAYYKKGKYRDALKYYELVLKRSPGNQEAQGAASLARRKLGR